MELRSRLSHQACVRLCTFCIPLIVIILAGCSSSFTVNGSGSSKTLKVITVSPGTDSLQQGNTAQFIAKGTYDDGSTADITSSASWSTASASIAKVTATGMVSAVSGGSTSISATLDGVTGTAQLTVTPITPDKTVQSISIKPASVSIQAGSTQQFTASATYSDSTISDVTSKVTWSVADSSIASVAPSGVATAVAAGATTITASLSGIVATAPLTVTAVAPTKTLTSISVTPSSASVAVGATQQYTATATYSDASTADITSTASWSVADTSYATITSGGLATGVAAGTTKVTATISGVSGSAAMTVTPAVGTKTLTSIAITPASISVAIGAAQQFTATATYSDSSTADVTAKATWSTGDASVATVSAGGLATGVAVGSTQVFAAVDGVQGKASLTVTKTLSSIAVSPGSATFAAGNTQPFTATATYSDGSVRDVTSTATWSTADSSIATVDAAGLAKGVGVGSTKVSATLNAVSGSASITVTAPAVQSIDVTPVSISLQTGDTQQFTAKATNSDGSTSDISSTANWSVDNTAVATVNSTGLVTAVSAGTTNVKASLNGTTGSVSITVAASSASAVNVTTWHFDNHRSGLNPGEQSLSPASVSAQTFGKLFSYEVDGYVYGEPLLVSNLEIAGGKHNVLFVATEKDSVYAFDADNYGDGKPLWQVSLLKSGETPLQSAPIQPYEGVTSTPVIDVASSTIYVVSSQKSSSAAGTHRLNALDLITGQQKFGGPVTLQASVPGTGKSAVNGQVSLTTSCMQRAALLLTNNTVYIGFGSCSTGWLLAYDATTLKQVGVFNSSPNLDGEGKYASAGGVWMGGGGPAADDAGNVYAVTGNGPWDGKTAWSDTILKFNSKLQIEDYFTPAAYQYMNCADADLAGGGLLLIPGTSQALAGGKLAHMFLVNTTNMGKEQANDAGATQALWFEADLSKPYSATCTDATGDHTTDISSYEIFGTAAYYNGSVYLGMTPTHTGVPAGIRQFTYSGTLTPGAITSPDVQLNTRGTTPFISSNGSKDGILWMIDTGQPLQNSGGNTPSKAVLHAYDAGHFPNELYNSATNSADTPGYGIKFSSPVVANGRVYISTGHDLTSVTDPKGEIDVYGLK